MPETIDDPHGAVELEVFAGKPTVIMRCLCSGVSVEVELTLPKAERFLTRFAEAVHAAKQQDRDGAA